MKWETQFMELECQTRERSGYYQTVCDALGKDGWELVQLEQPQTLRNGTIERRLAVFKRQKPEEDTRQLLTEQLREDARIARAIAEAERGAPLIDVETGEEIVSGEFTGREGPALLCVIRGCPNRMHKGLKICKQHLEADSSKRLGPTPADYETVRLRLEREAVEEAARRHTEDSSRSVHRGGDHADVTDRETGP